MGFLAVLCIILAVAGIAGTLALLISAAVAKKYKMGLLGGGVFVGILTVLVVLGASFFISVHYENHFYNLHEEYQTSKANVEVIESKAEVLGEKLTTLLDSYIGHEGNLIDAVEGRNAEELRMLFERYPQLQASSNVQQVTDEFITLTEDIATARLVVNAVARAYNTSQYVFPSRHFAPGELPESLPLFSTE